MYLWELMTLPASLQNGRGCKVTDLSKLAMDLEKAEIVDNSTY
jgi:hypothetical protein